MVYDNAIYQLASDVSLQAIQLMKQHGFIVTMLALVGAFAIVTAIVNEAFKALKYLFMLFVAFPIILVFGLVRRDLRKQRLKELGEIRAFVKIHPDRFVRIIMWGIICLFIIAMLFVTYYVFMHLVVPLKQVNDLTKGGNLNLTNVSNVEKTVDIIEGTR